MTYLPKILVVISITAFASAFIFIALTMYVSSGEDPCRDSETIGEYRACQLMDRAEERCKGLKGTDIYIKCIVGGT